jgi:hypothetical protein
MPTPPSGSRGFVFPFVLTTLLTIVLVGCGGGGKILPPLAIITQSPLPSGRASVAYNMTFSATGGVSPYSWNAANLPPGLVMSSAGTLLGTPSQGGSFTLTVAVSDTAKATTSGNFAITIAAPLQITTNSLPNGITSVPYQAMLAGTGGFAPYTWSITQGTLPSGLTLNATSGLISGMTTGSGTSTFTVQVSDAGTPQATAKDNLSITINVPPARSAALYVLGGTALQVANDGSLSPLPSSPESQLEGTQALADSPTLPLLFAVAGTGTPGVQNEIESLLVNPDYSLSLYNSSGVLPVSTDQCRYWPSVDPTGSNLYVTGCVDSGGDPGILIYPADGSLQVSGSVPVSGGALSELSRMTFTPNGSMGFVASCTVSNAPTIFSYSRASNGMLTLLATYNLPANSCLLGVMVSPTGGYLVGWQGSGVVQVFSIASGGSLTPATQPFTIMKDPKDPLAALFDVAWDSSGAYLVAALNETGTFPGGGLALLNFSGSSLSQNAYPTGQGSERVVRNGAFFYAGACAGAACTSLQGFDLQNGQLNPLPGSPWPSIFANSSDFVIY